MWRIKAPGRPRRRAQPRRVLSRDPGVHLRDLKSHAGDRGRRPTRTRASSAASASPSAPAATSRPRRASGSSCAARWRASPRARPCAAALAEQYAYDGDRDLRGRRLVPARPARSAIDTGTLIKELRAPEHASRAERDGARRAALGASSAPRARLRAGPIRGSACAADRAARRARARRGGAAWSRLPGPAPARAARDRARRAPPPSTCPPA